VKKIFLFLFFPILSLASELTFSGNQSDIHWKTAQTEHFVYEYPAEYSGHANIVASYAEAVYDSVVSRYRIDLPQKVNLSLQNSLISNGMAIPSENAVNLSLSNWDFKVRSSHTWVSDVVTHEFSHLASIESGSKLSHFIYGLQLSYTDYYNERDVENFAFTFPFSLQPLWLAEGTAQFESSRMGFDSWDSHRDMLLRVAVLNDGLLDLTYMHDFADNSLDAELGPYTQGFSLVRYIDAHYGPNAIPKIWSELARIHRVTLDAALEDVIGIGEEELYKNWKEEITKNYEEQEKSLGKLATGKKWTSDAFYNDFPIVSDSSIYGISNFGGAWFDGGIFKIPKSAEDSIAFKDSASGETITIQDSVIDIKKYAKSGFDPEKPWFDKGISVRDIESRGPTLAYVTYKNRDRNGHAHFDIAVLDTNGELQMATKLADAVYPDISPNGNEIVFARRETNSTRFILSKVAVPEKSSKTNDEYIDIFTPKEQYLYYNIYSPKFSPDGKKIAFSFFDDTTRGIAIINSDGTRFTDLSQKGFDLRDPNWIDNGTLIYSSNKNGIYNLYSKKLPDGREHPLTNVVGGAFTPVVDSNTVYYTGYDKDGFSLYSIELTDYDATKDSTFKVSDTTYTKCPSNPVVSTADTNAADSSTKITCKIDTLIATRDSTIKKSAIPPIVLKGTLPEKIHKTIEKPEIEFAGSERDYKAIPTVPLIAPIFSISERAPDFGAIGDGKATPKLGMVMELSDPLKKNIITAGLLLEVGNGWDYINSDGINPEKEREFLVAIENRSTPITLGLSYTNINYRSKDTVRYEDPRSYDDSIATNNYAIPVSAVVGTAGYSVFKQGDSLIAAIGYDWADFNLYENNLSWTYQKRISGGIGASFIGGTSDETQDNTVGMGNGISLAYQISNSDLYRPGTFSESFTVSPSGKIEPIYRNYTLHNISLSMYGSLPNPIHDNARFAAGASISGILNWSAKDSKDTLDSYYYEPLLLDGYPYLITSEDYNRSGMKAAKAEIHYLFPIFDDFRNQFWIFTTKDLYVNLYAQVGAAWNDHGLPWSKIKTREFWDRSVGIEFRVANRIFYSLPFNISFNLARGLDRIGEDIYGKGGRKMNPLDIPILPSAISPTKVTFSVGFNFNDSWME